MSRQSKRNRRKLDRGSAMRPSEVQDGKGGGKRVMPLLPSLAAPPGRDPVDPAELASDVARLSELGRRRPSG